MAYSEPAPPDEMKLSDEELLSILEAERQASVGFENGSELETRREKALQYYKGEMKDVPSLPNRSKAVDTAIADAVETVMPDIMEIFTGGEDVATFPPVGPEDEEAAAQETDWVNHVAFNKLPGFRILHTAIKDAFLTDTGVIETWVEEQENIQSQNYEGITAIQLQMLEADGFTITEQTAMPPGQDGVELFNVTAEYAENYKCVKSAAVDPANITVAEDTIDIAEATYACVRSFPRAQALVDRGFPEDKVSQLKDYAGRGTEQTEQARDVAGETDATSGTVNRKLRTVEVHKHWLRVDGDEDGKTELWCIHSDSECKVILDKRKVSRIGLAVGTPFLLSHRFYGLSLADKLSEVQKIKTALLRMMLDAGYFAMNQRVEVASELADDDLTIADILRNEPGAPIRVKKPGAVNPVQAGSLGYDVLGALEYTATLAEMKSGVVRNAQGLNPDTLHDTEGGMEKLFSAAQRRVRMIARVLAETLVKKWLLDIHAFSREHGTRQEKIRLRGKWVDIDPSQFGSRSDMTIAVGVGSGGKEVELAVMQQIMGVQEKYVLARGGFGGMVQEINLYNAAKRFCERAGQKAPELFFTDPAQAPPEQPKPDPEMMKVQAQIEGDKAKTAAQAQNDQAKAASQAEIERFKAENDAQLAREKAAFEAKLAEAKAAFEMQMETRRMDMEMDMARQRHAHDMVISKEKADNDNKLKKNRAGGDLSE